MNRTEDWMLQIKRTQPTDVGDYECQINMHLLIYFVHLTVLQMFVQDNTAPGPDPGVPELFINSRSSINVSGAIEHRPEPPVFVFWYHNDRLINYDAAKGQDAYVSSLFIRNSRPQDSGNYTYGPSNADSTSVVVHVLNGERRAAMQHDLSPPGAPLRVTLDASLVLCAVLTTLGSASRLTSS
ncbi:hypothetical protein HPB47_020695 [Ixodes persulcatus]|uniref:Uncharacterized protein n=1 Tax=Ixodes persulcatus TaxID=34615 RepID=A0AC60QEK7_IXOPE|nr:hypothetical protein HPB47_020695 [Ixodes persulcatus]